MVPIPDAPGSEISARMEPDFLSSCVSQEPMKFYGKAAIAAKISLVKPAEINHTE